MFTKKKIKYIFLSNILIALGIYFVHQVDLTDQDFKSLESQNIVSTGVPGVISESDRIQVLVLGYQRSGSTFMGQLLNQNPEAFYWYEPGDAVYSSIYKTLSGWNVPANIFHFKNGTKRTLPKYEIDVMVDVVSNIFKCNIHSLPIELLINPYHRKFNAEQNKFKPYLACVPWLKVTQTLAECRRIYAMCPKSFQPHLNLTGSCAQGSILRYSSSAENTSSSVEVQKYDSCMQKVYNYIKECLQKITSNCEKAKIVSTKTVRVTMETVKLLLDKFPDLHVIHYLRDPRAVVASRLSQGQSFISSYGMFSYTKEARILCDQMLHDVSLSRELDKQHPSRIIQIFYEDLALNTQQTLGRIYKFIGKSIPGKVVDWLMINTNKIGPKYSWTNRDAAITATHWMRHLPHKKVAQIDAECQTLYEALHYPWSKYYNRTNI